MFTSQTFFWWVQHVQPFWVWIEKNNTMLIVVENSSSLFIKAGQGEGGGGEQGQGSCFEKREYHLFSYYPFPVNRTWRRAVGNMGRLRHIRRAIARVRLDTSLKHLRRAKKSMPCFIQKASRCVADRTSKTATLFIFHFLYSTKILREYHLYLFFISLVQWRKLHYIFIFFT